DELAEINPLVQRDQFHIAAHPFPSDVAGAIFELDGIEAEIFAVGLEITAVGRARPLLAPAIDEQLVEIPFAFADLGDLGLPQAGFAIYLFPPGDPPPSAENWRLVAKGRDCQWMVGATT